MRELPAKGAMLQYHFARLYLCSHVFRGLHSSVPIPESLREAARTATSAAVDMIQLCLTDPHMGGVALTNCPTHVFGMLCFACVFLLGVATKRRDGLVEVGLITDLATGLVQQFRELAVSTWHPAYTAADMLGRTAATYLPGKGRDMGSGSRRGSTVTTADRTGGIMDEAFKRAFSLFPDSNMSVMGTDTGAGSSAGASRAAGVTGPPASVASLDSPGMGFGTPNYFDFGGGSQSGQGGI